MTSLAVLGILGAVVCYLAARIAGGLMTDEVKGWLPYVGRTLIRAAVRRLPAEHQERWDADWRAELYDKYDRPLTMLAYALGVRSKARSLRAELDEQGQSDEQVLDPVMASDLVEIQAQYDEGLISASESAQATFETTKGLDLRKRVNLARTSVGSEKGFIRSLHECDPYGKRIRRLRWRIHKMRRNIVSGSPESGTKGRGRR